MALRDQAMLMRKLQGDRTTDIAKLFNCQVTTAERGLARARRAGYIDTARTYMLTNLLAPSLAALQAGIEAGDSELALKVLEAVGVVGKNASVLADVRGGGEVVEEFEAFRRRVVHKVEHIAAEGDDGFTEAEYASTPAGDRDAADADPARAQGRGPDDLYRLLPGAPERGDGDE